jgi:succinate dehydrogenase / fumarate reductase flavoprotein subunit
MGGIKVDAETAATRVPGLYAAGECAGGMSGATRLGGNSLSDLLVFGKRAGAAAVEGAGTAPVPEVDDAVVAEAEAELLGYLGEGGEDPYDLHADLQATMQAHVGIYRDEAGLDAALGELGRLEARARTLRVAATGRSFNSGWHLCKDVRNMLTCAEAITRSALLRTESRGAHSRLDFPELSPEWAEHNIVARRGPDGRMGVERRPVVKADDLAPLVAQRLARERV